MYIVLQILWQDFSCDEHKMTDVEFDQLMEERAKMDQQQKVVKVEKSSVKRRCHKSAHRKRKEVNNNSVPEAGRLMQVDNVNYISSQSHLDLSQLYHCEHVGAADCSVPELLTAEVIAGRCFAPNCSYTMLTAAANFLHKNKLCGCRID